MDDYFNNTNPENSGKENINADQDNTTIYQDQSADKNESPASEPKKEEAHTFIPGGTQDQNAYGSYQPQNGQYRIVYNRTQNTTNTNAYGNQSYGQNQNANPYSQSYGNYYNNGNYNYQNTQTNNQTYRQQYQQYQQPYRQPPVNQPPKKSGGKIAAVIAVCAALAIIFSVVSLVFGVIIGRRVNNNSNSNNAIDPPATDNIGSETTEPAAEDTKPSSSVSAETTQLTDPDAKINTSVSGEPLSMTEAAAKTVDSVVEILTEQTVKGSFMQQYVVQGGGSGIIITEDGYIATNNHVIEDATQIKITLRNGQSYDAKLVGTDATADLAVVKIDVTGLKPATFGDSSKLVVAESVFAIGNPLGELGGTVTQGIVSALERTITIDNQEMTLLQTTAAINPGNSGGGLFNLAGECVGVVNAKSSGSGIEGLAFAIPSNTAVKVIEDLMQYGYVRGRVMLGISMLEVSDQYTLYRYNLKEYGVYVSKVYENSDAEKYGIKVADRLISIDGVQINTSADARKQIQTHSVGDTAKIVVSRNGEEVTLDVKLSEYIPNDSTLS